MNRLAMSRLQCWNVCVCVCVCVALARFNSVTHKNIYSVILFIEDIIQTAKCLLIFVDTRNKTQHVK